MYELYENEQLDHGRTIKTTIEFADSLITYADILQGWQHDGAFRAFFTDLLVTAPFIAFRWETPLITTTTTTRPFEFVLLNAPTISQDLATTQNLSWRIRLYNQSERYGKRIR